MRNFKTEDFGGAGQYLLRIGPNEKENIEKDIPFHNYQKTSYLSTIIVKVGYKYSGTNGNHAVYLIAMSDGLIYNEFESSNSSPDEAKQKLCDYLNDEKNDEYRFATQEEMVRIVLYQSSRWRN